jgi:histone deacetylase 11
VVVVYHPKYLYGSAFINTLHPFVFDRARQVEALLRAELGSELDGILRSPEAPASAEQLAAIHDHSYLSRVHRSGVIAGVVELRLLAWCPRFLMRRWFVEPTLWCMAGTLLAGREALKEGLAYNAGGGLHHAKRAWGEGFCLFSDIALTITTLRAEGSLAPDDPIFYIDLDVHQGNGVSTDFAGDPAVRILDIFNEDIYPYDDQPALAGIDVARPLPSGTSDEEYLRVLEQALDELFEGQPLPKLVLYNAGSDVFSDDLLGRMKLSREGVNRRDLTVLEAIRGRGIPMLAMASGGYSRSSAQLIVDFILGAHRYEKNRPGTGTGGK